LYEQNKKIIFIIEDDGKGYDQHEQKDSFGLFFVSALAHDELLATLEVESDNGTRYIITWDA
jgi:two-component sensor histidine kinase